MNPSSPFFVLIALILVLLTIKLFPKNFVPEVSVGRFNSIDGLRGYLAYFVFLHHSIIWYFYLHDGRWMVPPTRLFRHFGQASVAMFFMITSFLFFTKILDSKNKNIDWVRIFISRIMRLVPLYLFAMFALFTIVFIISEGQLNESISDFTKNSIKWLSFTIMGDPDLNGVSKTNLIVAGVTWSLPYEWFFYFSLPVLAVITRIKVPVGILLMSILSLVAFYFFEPQWYHLTAFAGGIIAALLIRNAKLVTFFQGKIGAFIFVASVCGVLFGYSSSYSKVPLLLLTIAFTVVASGNSVFGAFTNKHSRALGEMAYSIYLLHGLALFITFRFILGYSKVVELSVYEYWTVIFILTPILLAICYFTFTYIEKTSMKKTDSLTQSVRNIFS